VAGGMVTVVGLASGIDVIVPSSALFPSLAATLRVANIGRGSFKSDPIISIIIPRNVESLCLSCFSFCQSLSFENDSRLRRIESKAFRGSALESITIPRNVEVLCSSCFENCESLSSISFENDSQLKRIESKAFHDSPLKSVTIPRNVKILCSSRFLFCRPLSSISFENDSQDKPVKPLVLYIVPSISTGPLSFNNCVVPRLDDERSLRPMPVAQNVPVACIQ
jgi:hypothetical protein